MTLDTKINSNLLSHTGNLSAQEAWEVINKNNTYLLDVRTSHEWFNVGAPDLSSINKKALFISWRNFPAMNINQSFADLVTTKIQDKDSTILIICKSGGRSQEAAEHLSSLGYKNCINIYDGFEGQPNHQGTTCKINGWVAANLPWSLNAAQ